MATKKKTSTSKSTSSGNVGLTATKIGTMQKALESYINEVTKKIKISASTATIQKAIKGSAAEAEAKKYITEIDKACEQYLQNLKKYNEKLTEMKNIYQTNDKFTR